MAFTLNATKGDILANSYATIAEADAMLEPLYLTEDWFQLEEVEKQKLLINASQWIDELSFRYERASEDQALQFPSAPPSGDTDDGFVKARQACIIQAFFMLRNFENIQSAQDEVLQGIRSQNLGAIQIGKGVVGFNPMNRYDSKVLRLLKPWLNLTFSIGRG